MQDKVSLAESRIEELATSIERQKEIHEETIRREKETRREFEKEIELLQERDKNLVRAWVQASEKYIRRIDWMIHLGLYVALGVSSVASAYMILSGSPNWLAPAITSAATLLGAFVAIAEKYRMIPRIGGNFLLSKQREYLTQRAEEAQRRDLLRFLKCDRLQRRIEFAEGSAEGQF